MSPPPVTPTPRRFLLPKRATQSSQTPTAAAPQFQSTPRFGSSSSVPRPTQSWRDRPTEDVEEEEDLVEESSLGGEDDDDDTGQHVPLHDSIEVESDGLTGEEDQATSSPAGTRGVTPGLPHLGALERAEPLTGTSSPYERGAKRRKVSISPAPEPSPLAQRTQDFTAVREEEEASTSEDIHDQGSSSDADEDGNPAEGTTEARTTTTHQPVFQPAPRFKPIDANPTPTEGLPAAFSPQRRGAKFLAGGLAAELQGWLSDVKGWGGGSEAEDERATEGPGSAPLRVEVRDVRPGRRMYLVSGRVGAGQGDGGARRFILAGEGRLTGLGRAAVVAAGSVVVVGPPVWDVGLDGVLWTVACDWAVE